jgi:hypothetical protein
MKNSILVIMLSICIVACNNSQTESSNENKRDELKYRDTTVVSNINLADSLLPFIGKKAFETRPGVSGTGTPHRYIEIDSSGNIYFSFEQVNQANGDITSGKYYAGKFKKYVKCIFKEWDNEIRYYEIGRDSIYEVDKNNIRLTNEDCCNSDNLDLNDKCPCESDLQ